ncbi:MAG: WG repeat-containing protein [Bacteroidaceae bacterium]|nr:WG repeat-containing protein [Bacteroidaceae bacterium]
MKVRLLIAGLLISAISLHAQKSSKTEQILIPAAVNDKCGFIDQTGKWIIQPKYYYAEKFAKNGLAHVIILTNNNGRSYCHDSWIDKTGKEIPQTLKFEYDTDFADNGLAVIIKDDKYGYIDKAGKIVINPQFKHAGCFANGLAAVKIKDKYGYIDKTGKIVIEPQFDYAFKFASNNLAAVKINDKYGYIDKTGKIVIEPQFKDAMCFYNGLAAVKIKDKYGYINKTGKIVIKPQFKDASCFSNGLAVVKIEDKYGYIDKTGKIVIEPQFDYASDFEDNGLACVSFHTSSFGYYYSRGGCIDKTGKTIIEPQYDGIEIYKNVILAKTKGKWGILDKTGKFIKAPEFDNVVKLSIPIVEVECPF